MNYRKWCERAKKFIYDLAKWRRKVVGGEFDPKRPTKIDPPEAKATIAPPLTVLGLKRLQNRLRLPLPPPAQEFLLKGSRRCYLHYAWNPPDGHRYLVCDVTICDAGEMVHWQEMCKEMAADLVDGPEIQEDWSKAVPFARLDADFLALDVRVNPENPPVISLSHETITLPLAPNLDQFLKDWQGLCYIHAEHFFMKDFWSRKKGFLDPESRKAVQLRKVFGLKE